MNTPSSRHSPRILIFGEVLFDCFPDGSRVLGGAPFNVAWNLQGLGASPTLVSRVGDDVAGREIRSAMETWSMTVAGMETDGQHGTGIVDIQLENGEPIYDIVADRAYDFIEARAVASSSNSFDLVVHGTLALRKNTSRESFDRLRSETGAPAFYDVNLRAPWWDRETVDNYVHRAHTVKLNVDELEMLVPTSDDASAKVEQLLARGPRTVCLTRGEEGADVYSEHGHQAHVDPDPDTNVVDTVGAGDAFASVFILGNVRGWDLPTTMQRAQQFAGAVVGLRGATVTDQEFYDSFRSAWS